MKGSKIKGGAMLVKNTVKTDRFSFAFTGYIHFFNWEEPTFALPLNRVEKLMFNQWYNEELKFRLVNWYKHTGQIPRYKIACQNLSNSYSK